jgi:uncharacterized protein (TIGR02246 family)
VFRGKFLGLLLPHIERGKLQIKSEEVKKAGEKSWIVYAKKPFGSPQTVLDYLGRYTRWPLTALCAAALLCNPHSRNLGAAPGFRPTSFYPPVVPVEVILQLDCLQPLGIKRYTLDDVRATPDQLTFDAFELWAWKEAPCPRSMLKSRPTLNANDTAMKEASDAVARFVAELQAGWDQHDADISDRHLAADIVWGSPFGATVHGYEKVHAIHVKLKEQSKGGLSSRFEVERVLVPAPGVAVAHVRRVALEPNGLPVEPSSDVSGPFSEIALYVLVRRDGTWCLLQVRTRHSDRGAQLERFHWLTGRGHRLQKSPET